MNLERINSDPGGRGAWSLERGWHGRGLAFPGSLALRGQMCDGAFVSDLVNYNTRGVQLPPGCKDLIDVLNLSVQDMPGFPKWPSGAQPEEIETGTLQDMEEAYQVSMITPLQFVYGRQPGGQW